MNVPNLDGLKKHQRRKRRKLMNIRAGGIEKLQVEKDHERSRAEKVEERASVPLNRIKIIRDCK